MRAAPANAEAEQAVISALLHGTPCDAVPLTEAHFFSNDCRVIFVAVRDLAEQGVDVNVHTVTAHLTAQGKLEHAGGPVARLLLGISGEKSLQHFYSHLEAARQAREVANYVRSKLPDLTASLLPASCFVEELNALSAPKAAALYVSGNEILAELDQMERTGATREAFRFGLPDLDEQLQGGIMREELGVVAGETGTGKTALMIQCAAEAAKAGIPTLYVSLELPATEVWNRCILAATRHKNGSQGFRGAMIEATSWPLFVASNVAELSAIGALIRAAVRKDKVALVVVDYLQIIEAPGDNRENKVSEAARYLKALASTEKVAIVTGSQLNEDGRLRESRAIGHHANVVLAIGDGVIECRKFRRGPWQWNVRAKLRGEFSRFLP